MLTQEEFIASLTEADIMSVYSGVNGKCCCGCSGKHTTNPLYQALRSEERGYKVDDDECSTRTVKAILNKIKRNVALTNEGDWQKGEFVSVVIGKHDTVVLWSGGSRQKRYEYPGRLYVAYLVPSDEEIAANRKRRAENKIKTGEAQVAAALQAVQALQGAGI